MSVNTAINPTFYLKRIKYDEIVENYNTGKYVSMPTLETTSKKNIGHLIYDNTGVVIGWRTVVGITTLVIYFNKPLSGICAHCELKTSEDNLCSFGIPEKIEKGHEPNTIIIKVDAETCSWECSAACVKKFGRVGLSLHPKYMDVNSMIRGLFNLYFPGIQQFNEALPVTDFVKYGGKKTPANFRSELHFYHSKEEVFQTIVVGSPKLVLNLK
jgi:hypothetical protein